MVKLLFFIHINYYDFLIRRVAVFLIILDYCHVRVRSLIQLRRLSHRLSLIFLFFIG